MHHGRAYQGGAIAAEALRVHFARNVIASISKIAKSHLSKPEPRRALLADGQ